MAVRTPAVDLDRGGSGLSRRDAELVGLAQLTSSLCMVVNRLSTGGYRCPCAAGADRSSKAPLPAHRAEGGERADNRAGNGSLVHANDPGASWTNVSAVSLMGAVARARTSFVCRRVKQHVRSMARTQGGLCLAMARFLHVQGSSDATPATGPNVLSTVGR